MPHRHKLSLMSAIFININIMMGSGIFINTVLLPKMAGLLGFSSYLIVGILLLPLILSLGALVREFPFGGFYTYGRNLISPFIGFFSAWSYFVAKLSAAALKVHIFTMFIKHAFPILDSVAALTIDAIVILIFTILNTLNMRVSNRVGYFFIVMKALPIIFVLITGLYLSGYATIDPATIFLTGLPSTLPYVLYAYIGFEASCSISQSIENPEKNAPRAIFISYIFVTIVNALYQLLFYLSTSGALTYQADYLGAFPLLLQKLLPHSQTIATQIVSIMHIGIATSALGGSYGVFFSNHWNLHTLANHRHIFFPRAFTWFNSHRIPVLCVITEGIIAFFYLLASNGNQLILQQIGALGPTIAYTISVLGILISFYRKPAIEINTWIPWFGLASCFLLLGASIRNFALFGAHSLKIYLPLVLIGIIMYISTIRRAQYRAGYLKDHES